MERCKPVLIRIGAAFDHAQGKLDPISFLLGMEISEDAERQDGNTLSNAIWESPVFIPPDTDGTCRLYVHYRFPLTYLHDTCSEWRIDYRLREQLLMQLVTTASSYVFRPSIVQLPVA